MDEPTLTASPRDDARSTIIEAASRLLREKGARGVTTRAVAEAAGIQAPTIYRLFGDKDGLIDAVAEHVMAAYVGALTAPPDDPADLLADLHAGWSTHVGFGLANPELYILLTAPGRGEHSPATAAGTDALRARIRRLATAGMLEVSEGRALDLLHAAGTGTILALLTTPVEDRDPGLPDAMFNAVARSITDSESRPPQEGPIAAAVAFASVVDQLPTLTDAERALMAEWTARSIAALQRV